MGLIAQEVELNEFSAPVEAKKATNFEIKVKKVLLCGRPGPNPS